MLAPTIIIGLGGAGSTIATKVSQHAASLKDNNRIRFICIDTDINDLQHRKEDDNSVIQIQTSAPYTIENYLKNNHTARDEWFPVNTILDGKTPTEGAGQVRAISRLAFDEAVNKGKLRRLDNAIDDLFKLDGNAPAQAVRVIIVSSLAGGTGSGIILPVAQYVKSYLQTKLNKSGSVIRGFFLLPEIFAKTKSADERASIYANAYAATRELDAFMRKGDGTLNGTKYEKMEMKIQDPQTRSTISLDVSPFNFCFLYDKRNANDQLLNSYDTYLEEAANTIFAQALSGAASRSNSSEDNAIKTLIESKGRNRFCAAGSSLLIYPKDKIVDYIAGTACSKQLTDQWLRIDKDYNDYVADMQELKAKDPTIEILSLDEFYINAIEGAEEGTFGYQMKLLCNKVTTDQDENVVQVEKMNLFTAALARAVNEAILNDPIWRDNYGKIKQSIQDYKDGIMKEDIDNFLQSIDDDVHKLGRVVRSCAERIGRRYASNVFKNSDDYTKSSEPTHMETYMKDSKDEFIHPNAARYFLYKLTKTLSSSLSGLDIKVSEKSEDYKRMKAPFDDFDTEDKEETALDQFGNRRRTKIKPGKREQYLDYVNNEFLKKALSYANNVALRTIYQAAVPVLQKMNKGYERFYGCFPTYAERNDRRISQIPAELKNGEGSATRYICSSQTCLNVMMDNFLSKNPEAEVNGPLSAKIFASVKDYSQLRKEVNDSKYFQTLFENGILDHFKNELNNKHQVAFDKDVLSALEDEIRFENASENLEIDDVLARAADVVESAGLLAAPFLEDPMGPERHTINASAYNPDILLDGDPLRKNFVQKYINEELGGVKDPNISKYELLIYKAVYNLNPGDLKRFRAPEPGQPKGGDYYKSYMDIYEKLGPDLQNNTVITPHLDRHWHLTKYMPDLDDNNQKILDEKIAKAFLWGMYSGEIEQTLNQKDPHSGKVSYSPSNSQKKEFIVSNGSFCDELYEVLDALEINPPQVDKIDQKYRELKGMNEEQERKSLAQTELMRRINWRNEETALGDFYDPDFVQDDEVKFVLYQYIPFDSQMRASLFDLLFWLKRSTPVSQYYDEDMVRLIDSLLDMLRDYVRSYVPADRVDEVCLSIISDQFELFMDNMLDNVSIPKPKNRFFDSCVTLIRDRIDEKVDHEYSIKFRSLPTMKTLYEKRLRDIYKEAAGH